MRMGRSRRILDGMACRLHACGDGQHLPASEMAAALVVSARNLARTAAFHAPVGSGS